MNTLTATPRTDAAWAASFSPEALGFHMRDLARTLERELSAMQNRAEKAEADCERFRLYTFKQDAKVAELLSMLA